MRLTIDQLADDYETELTSRWITVNNWINNSAADPTTPTIEIEAISHKSIIKSTDCHEKAEGKVNQHQTNVEAFPLPLRPPIFVVLSRPETKDERQDNPNLNIFPSKTKKKKKKNYKKPKFNKNMREMEEILGDLWRDDNLKRQQQQQQFLVTFVFMNISINSQR